MIVTFLSDFGLQDDFVGTCHGVMARIAPGVRVIDITHGIEPQAVMQGAIVLRNTVPYLPVGVHLAVVDPGVGGTRRAVAVRARDGRTFVGPDNGLLLLAADAAGIESAHELVEPRYRLGDV
ncbi:MAG TPA: SAM-dependent chlorinase/fluorinase, partial [Gaiellaceae bacterium]|nr:SAM-dependent chlorinase/fluorinase [Gaiellaceae bacterium]